jgi:hypothetical protein
MSSKGNFNPEDFVDEEYAGEEFFTEDMDEYIGEGLNEEDYDHMAEFEDMLEVEEPLGGSLSRQGSASSAVSDTWYPECMNCPCCHGMKHGCECIKGGVETCANADCVDKVFAEQVTKSINERQAQDTANPNPSIRANHVFMGEMGTNSPRSTQATRVCIYFQNGYCSFGDRCRNLHSGGSSREGGKVVETGSEQQQQQHSTVSSSSQQCKEHAQGACALGNRCKFGHF